MKIEAAVGGTWLAGGMRFEKTIWFFAQRRHGSFRFFCILLFKSQYLRLQREASEASLRSRQVEQHNATREQAGVKGGSKKWQRSWWKVLSVQFPGATCYNLDHIGSKRKQIDQLQDLCNCSCKVIFWTSVRSLRVRQIGRLAQLGLVFELLRAGFKYQWLY